MFFVVFFFSSLFVFNHSQGSSAKTLRGQIQLSQSLPALLPGTVPGAEGRAGGRSCPSGALSPDLAVLAHSSSSASRAKHGAKLCPLLTHPMPQIPLSPTLTALFSASRCELCSLHCRGKRTGCKSRTAPGAFENADKHQ